MWFKVILANGIEIGLGMTMLLILRSMNNSHHCLHRVIIIIEIQTDLQCHMRWLLCFYDEASQTLRMKADCERFFSNLLLQTVAEVCISQPAENVFLHKCVVIVTVIPVPASSGG